VNVSFRYDNRPGSPACGGGVVMHLAVEADLRSGGIEHVDHVRVFAASVRSTIRVSCRFHPPFSPALEVESAGDYLIVAAICGVHVPVDSDRFSSFAQLAVGVDRHGPNLRCPESCR